MSFIYEPTGNCTYGLTLNQNGEVIEEKIFNFSFQRKSRAFQNKQNQNQDQEPLSKEQDVCMNLY